MSVRSYIVNLQTETLAAKFQGRVCVNYGKEIHKTGTVVESEKFKDYKNKADYLIKEIIGFFIFA